jgi:transcriptional regulator with XRE-family HTH domain
MIYERIRNLREDSDLTQTNMASYLHITQRTYSRYETGERSIPIEILCELADYHQTSVDYLLGRTNIKKPYPHAFTKSTQRGKNCKIQK